MPSHATLYKSPEVRRLLRSLRKAAPELIFTARSREQHNARRKSLGIPPVWEVLRNRNSALSDKPNSSVPLQPIRDPIAKPKHTVAGETIPARVNRGFSAGLTDKKQPGKTQALVSPASDKYRTKSKKDLSD